MNIKKIIKSFQNCSCGDKHQCDLKYVLAKDGVVHIVGKVLEKHKFPKNLLLVADVNTINASKGIIESLEKYNFKLTYKIYDFLRVATMQDVNGIETLLNNGIEGVVAVGTGSVHDTCRLACSKQNKPLCLFATAPSMDGFASDNAPIVDNCFKSSYSSKAPDIVLADTNILANSPSHLKSAGFGDMIAKYVALIDWKVSHLITGEKYCEKVASLTKMAADKMMKLADSITKNDKKTAKAIFEALVLTGIAMSFTKTSRPGSGTEHIMSHYWECKELLINKIPNYHGQDVGVATLIMLKIYNEFAKHKKIVTHKANVNWQEVYSAYGEHLAKEVKKLNSPVAITDTIEPSLIEENWQKIVDIINSVPSYEQCYNAMKRAGCLLTPDEIGKSPEFVEECIKFHPFMRNRLSLLRLKQLFDFAD